MKPQPPPAKTHSEIETVRLVWLAIFVSVFSFLYYNRNGELLLYGDAVAHINIARRVFDSKTPGLLQLGTVWLPLPHLLILPFIVSKQMWQSGSGGSIPSMAAYVLGVLGIFRLVRSALSREGKVDDASQLLAWSAAIVYAANPNLIYMQATAMGESLYLAFFIWAAVYFAEFARGEETSSRSVTKCGVCLVAACLTRYDGWFLAVLMVAGAVIVVFHPRNDRNDKLPNIAPASRISLLKFVLIAAAAPVFWLAYNAAVYRNPLEFANGPYSAHAIEQKTATVNQAQRNLWAGASYFLKAAELNVSEANWLGRLWLALALLGSLAATFTARGRLALFLWAPLPFYALSLAYGSVPIFLPTWWPFSYYNVRYGLQLLPAFAVFVPLGIYFMVQFAAKIEQGNALVVRRASTIVLVSVLALASASYGGIWHADPVCYREAAINSRGRAALDKQVAAWLKPVPADSTLLMYLGEHVGALQQAAIPLRRVINEGNHRVWKQPTDLDGLWERALANPGVYADFVIGFDGDPVWKAATDHHLTALVEIHTTGQPRAIIFRGREQERGPKSGQ
ncbi:MAG: hypothetical protein QOF56_2766 [Acidobacteriaceae bacterium]|jgi:hypothetical protein|nr:hypothetical protein [Acidobacteriaceae bacterium]